MNCGHICKQHCGTPWQCGMAAPVEPIPTAPATELYEGNFWPVYRRLRKLRFGRVRSFWLAARVSCF